MELCKEMCYMVYFFIPNATYSNSFVFFPESLWCASVAICDVLTWLLENNISFSLKIIDVPDHVSLSGCKK